jgi:steroid delta-isomerase-like uncharacterized protein
VKLTLALVLLAFTPFSLAAASAPQSSVPSAPEQNESVARRVFDEIFNQGRFQTADEIYAPDFVNHGLHRDFSLQEDQAAARWEKTTLPDMTITVDLITAEEDLVTVVWTARGTNTRSLGWLPATHVHIELRGITVWRIVDGKIREEWTAFDSSQIARQVLTQLEWPILGLVCVLLVLARLLFRLVSRFRKLRPA